MDEKQFIFFYHVIDNLLFGYTHLFRLGYRKNFFFLIFCFFLFFLIIFFTRYLLLNRKVQKDQV